MSPLSPVRSQYPVIHRLLADRFSHFEELKKDPGVPRLPSLKVRNAGKEKLHGVCLILPPKWPQCLIFRLQTSSIHTKDADAVMASEPTLASLAEQAAASADISDPSSSTQAEQSEKFRTKEQQRRHYIKTLHRVIDESDVILLVLDARDPEGCRSRLVEEEVRRRESEGKRLVFVLNKVGAYHLFSTLSSVLIGAMKISFRPLMPKHGFGTSDIAHQPFLSALSPRQAQITYPPPPLPL